MNPSGLLYWKEVGRKLSLKLLVGQRAQRPAPLHSIATESLSSCFDTSCQRAYFKQTFTCGHLPNRNFGFAT